MVHSTWKTLLMIGLIFLAGCSAATPQVQATQAPSVDANAIRTQAASTVMAQYALTPSATRPAAPTATQAATAAPTNTSAPAANTDATQTPQPSATNAATLNAAGTLTATIALVDQARWVTQNVNDGTQFAPGADFVMIWQIKNVGTSTWTAGYRLRFFSGNAFGAPNEIALDKEVAPNDTVEISAAMKAPTTPGKYNSTWVMSNEALRNFNQPVFVQIVVPSPTGTPTKTKVPTATLTATPTPNK